MCILAHRLDAESLERGQADVETDFLNGEVVLLGRMHNVATPGNAALQRCAQRMLAVSAPPGSATIEELKREIVALGGAAE